jgi:hypothetical protein
MRGWVGPRPGLDGVERSKNLAPTWTLTPTSSAVQSVASRYTDRAIPAPFIYNSGLSIYKRSNFKLWTSVQDRGRGQLETEQENGVAEFKRKSHAALEAK